MTIPISDFRSFQVDKNYNTNSKQNISKEEKLVAQPELKQVGDNFSSPIIKSPKNESPVVQMFDDLISNDSMDQKMKAISDKEDNSANNKFYEISVGANKNNAYKLLSGDCKIKYRFPTDIKKSTFSPVQNDPKEYGKNKDFFYVNGINTKDFEAKKTYSILSKLSGQDVKPIYNKTDGVAKDLLEATIERLSNSHFDDVTKKTALCFYDTLSSGRDLKIMAHSQGAAITADALKLCEKMLLTKAENPYKIKDTKIGTYAESDNTKIKFNDAIYSKSVSEVSKIMSKVEVITMGGAASQDKFPNIKLVEVFNPKDPVPKIAGDDLIQIKKCRKEVTVGNVSYANNSKNMLNTSNFLFNKDIQHVSNGWRNLKTSIVSSITDFAFNNKNVIDYHKVDEGSNAYLNQMSVRSLIYNFGRQDFQ